MLGGKLLTDSCVHGELASASSAELGTLLQLACRPEAK